jgi:Zn-dependent M28 family amino/carboxypeptidase
VELRGTRLPEEVVVIGAHYDTVPGSPGANDNGTGVAALLALARAFPPGTALARTLRLVAFVNEEAPFAHTPDMGSFVYARACRERGDQIVAMLSLETMGCFSDEEGSQRYPTSLRRLYPRTGSFIAFVGDAASKPLVQRVVGSFRSHARFPSEGAALPRIVRDAGRSDHWSFWQHGYRALMVTDTANFRYRHYHTAEDLPAEVDHARLARVVSGLGAVVRDLLAE